MNKLIAIAINEYEDPLIPNLQNCVNDANAIIDILSAKYQFNDIEILSSKESTTLVSLYQNLYDRIINALEEDNIVIYFAGHGEFHQKLNSSYWFCSDSQKANVTSWFDVGILNKLFYASPSKHIALVSDSCFSGAIFEKSRGGGSIALDIYGYCSNNPLMYNDPLGNTEEELRKELKYRVENENEDYTKVGDDVYLGNQGVFTGWRSPYKWFYGLYVVGGDGASNQVYVGGVSK